ncbi:MAG: hypothetical protein ACRC6A_07925 [Fusobacteriaceae bacterium]
MKKLLMTISFILLTGTALAKADSIYNFDSLEKNMVKSGYTLEYAKKDVGFNFKKGTSHAEVVGYKDYAATTVALSEMFNLVYKNGLEMIPQESDIANGVYVFSYPKTPDKVLVIVADFDHTTIMNAFGTAEELKTTIKYLEDAQVKK